MSDKQNIAPPLVQLLATIKADCERIHEIHAKCRCGINWAVGNCGCIDKADAVIDELEERLKGACHKCGSAEIGRRHIGSPPHHTETHWWECDDCGHQWGHE